MTNTIQPTADDKGPGNSPDPTTPSNPTGNANSSNPPKPATPTYPTGVGDKTKTTLRQILNLPGRGYICEQLSGLR